MGTSSAYGGPGGSTPLVPTWLQPDGPEVPTAPNATPLNVGQDNEVPVAPRPAPTDRPPIQPPPMAGRFTTARTNFTRFARSGGADRASLGRAVTGYVSKAAGGSRQAARRMGSSRQAGANLLGFLSTVRSQGVREALRALNLENLAGRPIQDVFVGLADYICPDGGTIDEGLARDAFIETIAGLAENGITDLDSLTADQMQTVFEMFATHAIEARLCNDIGAKTILLPQNVRAAQQVQAQLRDFIRRGVSDALTANIDKLHSVTADRVLGFVGEVYEQAFTILQAMGNAEAT